MDKNKEDANEDGLRTLNDLHCKLTRW